MMMPLLAALLAGCLISVLLRCPAAATASFALLMNWAANTAIVQISGDPFPSLAFIVVDYLTALSLFAAIKGWPRVFLVASYGLSIVCHVAYVISNQDAFAQYNYWWTLYYIAWSQILSVGAWIGGEMVLRRRRRRNSGASPVHALAQTGEKP